MTRACLRLHNLLRRPGGRALGGDAAAAAAEEEEVVVSAREEAAQVQPSPQGAVVEMQHCAEGEGEAVAFKLGCNEHTTH